MVWDLTAPTDTPVLLHTTVRFTGVLMLIDRSIDRLSSSKQHGARYQSHKDLPTTGISNSGSGAGNEFG